MPGLIDLTFKPSAKQPELPTGVYPHLAPAIYRGDGYSLRFILTNNGEPYEPEGILTAQLRSQRLSAGVTAGDPLATFAVEASGNEVVISLTGAQTAALPARCVWDIQESFEDAEPRTWFTGNVEAWGDITRAAT